VRARALPWAIFVLSLRERAECGEDLCCPRSENPDLGHPIRVGMRFVPALRGGMDLRVLFPRVALAPQRAKAARRGLAALHPGLFSFSPYGRKSRVRSYAFRGLERKTWGTRGDADSCFPRSENPDQPKSACAARENPGHPGFGKLRDLYLDALDATPIRSTVRGSSQILPEGERENSPG
jgi:hypothetical protein